jgi:hypothetical protein
MREFIKYILTKYTVSLYLISTLLLLITTIVPMHKILKIPNEFFTIIGSGIFITTLVSSILNFYFQEEVKRHFSIISGSDRSGIVRVYPKRESAMPEINSEIQKARGRLKFLSIAGTNFFVPESRILNELYEMCNSDSNIEVKILLLDPRSMHAVDRTLLEEGINIPQVNISSIDYPNKKLCEDIILSIRQLEKILEEKDKKHKDNFKIEIRTYNTSPILLMVQVNDRSFIEQYHYGISEEYIETTLTRCLGKKVPIIEFQMNSLPYQLVSSHFEYLWWTSASRKIFPGSADFLLSEMKDRKVWLEIYNKTNAISEEYLEIRQEGILSTIS